MNWIAKPLMIVTPAIILVLAVVTNATALQIDTLSCSCSSVVEYNTKLPMSHPNNRCATQQKSGISWSSWFSGNSRSSQFHYLDLLELLTRGKDSQTRARSEHNS